MEGGAFSESTQCLWIFIENTCFYCIFWKIYEQACTCEQLYFSHLFPLHYLLILHEALAQSWVFSWVLFKGSRTCIFHFHWFWCADTLSRAHLALIHTTSCVLRERAEICLTAESGVGVCTPLSLQRSPEKFYGVRGLSHVGEPLASPLPEIAGQL